MPTPPSPPPKPVSEIWRPDLTRLPRLNGPRRLLRGFARLLARAVIRICTRAAIKGGGLFPSAGPALVVINHLGDADIPLLLAALPASLDSLAKIELYDLPVLGVLLDWYGVIWLHRGHPDRRALRAALSGLAEGRVLLIAPEGRYTLVQGLEQGSEGAAFLALKADAPIIPVALTGTENRNVYGHLRRLRRARVTLTVGEPFHLMAAAAGPDRMQPGTQQIMESLARLLPEEYRGIYNGSTDNMKLNR
jgi:1-acyl-sn-glycerol-3-phosphate acyltransferase